MFNSEHIVRPILKHILLDMPAGESVLPWYLVQLRPNGRLMAGRNLVRQGFSVFCPTCPVTRKRGPKFVKSWQPLFSGYLFLGFDPNTAPWRAINSTYGVSRLVSFGGEAPKAVPNALIDGLRRRCDDAGHMLPPERLEPGDKVRILSGAFADFVTTIDAVGGNQRVWVLLDLLGSKTRVSLDCAILQRA